MKDLFTVLGAAFVVVFVLVFVGLLISYPFMLLWNSCVVPAISGVHEIEWIQAWGILIVCGFMFKNSTTGKAGE